MRKIAVEHTILKKLCNAKPAYDIKESSFAHCETGTMQNVYQSFFSVYQHLDRHCGIHKGIGSLDLLWFLS